MTEQLCVNTIRALSVDTVAAANSGHPGMPMGMAPVAHVLWSQFLSVSPKNPKWANRDRFILSNGHGSALQYSLLHLFGFNLSIKDLKAFRQLHSKTPGHPENTETDGVEVTTGPLGQGLCNGVGMAMSLEHSKTRFNTKDFDLLNHHIYVFCGDGCLEEGVTSEASSLAGHLGLGSLIVIYDDNKITIDGNTSITFTEDVTKRYESYGWQVLTVENGDDDLKSIAKAIEEAKSETNKPTLICLKTTIGYGSLLQGKSKVHGAPLSKDDISQVKKKFGLKDESFYVDEKVYEFYKSISKKNNEKEENWQKLLQEYSKAEPKLFEQFDNLMKGNFVDLEKVLPTYKTTDKAVGTRKLSGVVLNKIAEVVPELIGGSADLAGSNITDLSCSKPFQKDSYDGRIIQFGVREHAMAAIANGIRAHSNYIPFVATFLNFMGYLAGASRLSALSHFQILYVMTHDSIGLGEDGPTHQPVETLAMLRATPNFLVFRPADGNEVSGSYLSMMNEKSTPSVISLSRQDVPQLEGSDIKKVAKGAYVLQDVEKPEIILISTGTEVSICVEAAKSLKNCRIVSMPCWELFEKQSSEYKQSVLLEGVPVLSVEALSTFGWSKYSHYQIGLTTFGKSGKFKDVYEYFGITEKNIIEKSNKLVQHYKGKQVPNLLDQLE
eukprot:gene12966-7626_t